LEEVVGWEDTSFGGFGVGVEAGAAAAAAAAATPWSRLELWGFEGGWLKGELTWAQATGLVLLTAWHMGGRGRAIALEPSVSSTKHKEGVSGLHLFVFVKTVSCGWFLMMLGGLSLDLRHLFGFEYLVCVGSVILVDLTYLGGLSPAQHMHNSSSLVATAGQACPIRFPGPGIESRIRTFDLAVHKGLVQ
jgi:hypothetical protein